MNISQGLAKYGREIIELEVSDRLYPDYKRLLSVTKEYADHEAEVWKESGAEQPDYHRKAIYSLEDVATSFEHYDRFLGKPMRVPGDAVVFMLRGRYMDTRPNMEFMRSASVQKILGLMRQSLGIGKDETVDG